MMSAKPEIVDQGRRTFIKAGTAVGGGLLIGFYLPGADRLAAADEVLPASFEPNAWIRIGKDGQVTIIVDKSEMGQGVMTALPMLVAEELEVDLAGIHTEFAPVGAAYVNPLIGLQLTGGSTSVRSSWERLRKAGATGRQMLVAAAAKTWGVKEDACRAEHGAVVHTATGRRLTYGVLAEKAATLPVPQEVALKASKDFRIIGKPTPRLDTPIKVNGRAGFGLDVQIPGMLIAAVVRCPVFGGKLAGFEKGHAMAVPGVRQVVAIDSGVAVVANNFWAAKQGAAALTVRWDEGPLARTSSADISKTYARLSRSPGLVANSRGDAAKALKGAPHRIEAVYEVPYLAHATMEPMNCTAHVRPDGCDVWAPTQSQGMAQQTAARITGLPPDSIRIHTTFLGGGFGRRAEQDFLAEAVQISKAVGAPVKVVWTREDDMRHDFYRPATYNVLHAGLGRDGMPVAWTHRIVGPSIMSRVFPSRVKNGIDPTSVEGAANLPYGVPNLHVDYVRHESGVPVGFWRSVGSSQNAFVTEGFVDELAHAAKQDPFEFRRRLLADSPRHKAVLELAAAKAGWGSPLPKGVARGIAVAEAFGSFVAEVAEVSVGHDGKVKVHRVVCAVDCGTAVNPDTVKFQMEGSIVYGLTAALKGAITIKNGRVEQGNFPDYPLLRMDEMPRVEVYIVPSEEALGGVGEPGVPPIAPAVVNAIFAATGKRIRRLPIRPTDLRKA
jgi:isoquinoline 1-oxidoreductase beta subunit